MPERAGGSHVPEGGRLISGIHAQAHAWEPCARRGKSCQPVSIRDGENPRLLVFPLQRICLVWCFTAHISSYQQPSRSEATPLLVLLRPSGEHIQIFLPSLLVFPPQSSDLAWSSTAHVERPLFHRGGSGSTEDQPGRYSSRNPSTTGCLAAQRAGQ